MIKNHILNDAFYIPTFKQNIFSVQAATNKGASEKFGHNYS